MKRYFVASCRQWERWLEERCHGQPLIQFRRSFALIWLVFDTVDLVFGQTAKNLLFLAKPMPGWELAALQLALILCEFALFWGWRPRWAALCACGLRGIFASFYGLNDFFYFCAACLILAQFDQERSAISPTVKAWPRDLFVLQTAWIYFSSALLKMNPPFLLGGDLYVRQNYLVRVLPLPYPSLFRSAVASLRFNAILAGAAVAGELTLAVVLVLWVFSPPRRETFRGIALALVFCIHGYAAYALNVYFFGASMVAAVFFLTRGSRGMPSHRKTNDESRVWA